MVQGLKPLYNLVQLAMSKKVESQVCILISL